MRFSLTAAVAGLSLLAAACNQTPAEPAKPEEAKPVADARFDQALTFACEGGGTLDVVLIDEPRSALVRLDGAAGKTLSMVDPGPDGSPELTYADADTKLVYAMGDAMTYEAGGAKKACTFKTVDLPAPTVEGVKHALTVADAGKSFEVKVGEKISIALVGVPTAGYVWGASKPPAWVKASDGPGGATSSAQRLPGFAGGSHWEVVIIEATAAGEGEIVLAQRRPWEDAAEPDAETFKFKLKAS